MEFLKEIGTIALLFYLAFAPVTIPITITLIIVLFVSLVKAIVRTDNIANYDRPPTPKTEMKKKLWDAMEETGKYENNDTSYN